nr:hypothetical protein [Accumulibacter sp.]
AVGSRSHGSSERPDSPDLVVENVSLPGTAQKGPSLKGSSPLGRYAKGFVPWQLATGAIC